MQNVTDNFPEHYSDPYPFEDFSPTLSQCFVIVIVGYLMARTELLSASDVKGVSGFASFFAMPGIICVSLADADFGDFRWELLVGIFLGKLFIFVLVAGFLMRLDGNIGIAGLVAIFCVQSNDLPVGNPLMSALYGYERPQMMKYLFLIPAMTVIIFVPVGNMMINVHRSQKKEQKHQDADHEDAGFKECLKQCIGKKTFLNHMLGIVKHPVVIATILGLVLNLIFKGDLPPVVHQPIKVAAATIPGIALALLGFNMVRRERYLISSAVVPATLLLVLKLVLTPVVLHSILRLLTDRTESSKLLSDFALLYGIVSPATAVFQLGPEFRKPLAAMSVALILTSFACFPISYVVARFTIVKNLKLSSYTPYLSGVLFWTACFSILCDVIVWIKIIWKKQCRQVPFCYIMFLVLTQVITCCGVLLWKLLGKDTWLIYFKMAFYYGGEISGYFWTGILAVMLICREKCSMFFGNGFSFLSFTALSLSALITTTMCLLIPYNNVQRVYIIGMEKTNFEFLQLITTTLLLFICLIVVSASLILHFKRSECRSESTDLRAFENTVFYMQEEEEASKEDIEQRRVEKQDNFEERNEAQFYYEEILRNSQGQKSPLFEGEWSFRLSSLILIQGLILFVRFVANMYKLVRSKAIEITIPLEFLQSTLFIGQGFFILLTFGVDIGTMSISLRKWLRRMRVGEDKVAPSNLVDFDPDGDVAQFCSQFYSYYFVPCFRDLAKERRWKKHIYKDCFWGHQLVNWLISEGVCRDDSDAEERGQKLLTGGVIRHVTEKHHFYDAPYLYYFVKKSL